MTESEDELPDKDSEEWTRAMRRQNQDEEIAYSNTWHKGRTYGRIYLWNE